MTENETFTRCWHCLKVLVEGDTIDEVAAVGIFDKPRLTHETCSNAAMRVINGLVVFPPAPHRFQP